MNPTSHMDEIAKLRRTATECSLNYAKAHHILNLIGCMVGESDHEKIPGKVAELARLYAVASVGTNVATIR
jgi:hypothetical protein